MLKVFKTTGWAFFPNSNYSKHCTHFLLRPAIFWLTQARFPTAVAIIVSQFVLIAYNLKECRDPWFPPRTLAMRTIRTLGMAQQLSQVPISPSAVSEARIQEK